MTDVLPTRRAALSTISTTMAAGVVASAIPVPAAAAGTLKLIAGTYAREGGKGLYPLTYDPARDHWQVEAPVSGIDDASFAVRSRRTGIWYVLREQAAGSVTAYAPGWARRGTAPTEGADPCYAAFDDSSGCLAVANYSSGSVTFYGVDPKTGAPRDPTLFRHTGTGPNHARQEAPHAHWVGFSPNRQWLHAVDLGADTIQAYRFDPGARTLAAPSPAWKAPPGAGPRHLIWHPKLPLAYVVCELSNAVITLKATADGRFTTERSNSTLPDRHTGASQAAHIAIDRAGRRLYVSNRGHDSIAVFALDDHGAPTLIQHIASGGDWPRFFLLLEKERQVLVANERSGMISVFKLDRDGKLLPTDQRLTVPGAVFLAPMA